MQKKILIITGGGSKHLEPFKNYEKEFGVEITIASFGQLSYITEGEKVAVEVDGQDAKNFDLVYIRLVGNRLEDASLLTQYVTSHNIRIVDSCYANSLVFPLTLSKAQELSLLYNANIPIPKTIFGNLKKLKEIGPSKLGFPFVIKRTDGKKSNAVWAPKKLAELDSLIDELLPQQKAGKRFLGQEFIEGSQRNRVLVIGNRPIACITRGTRWRRRFIDKVDGEFPEKISAVLDPIPQEDAELAVRAAQAVGLEIAGVDILTVDKTGKKIVLEVNSAPRWYSITRDTGISVEREIIKYLASLI